MRNITCIAYRHCAVYVIYIKGSKYTFSFALHSLCDFSAGLQCSRTNSNYFIKPCVVCVPHLRRKKQSKDSIIKNTHISGYFFFKVKSSLVLSIEENLTICNYKVIMLLHKFLTYKTLLTQKYRLSSGNSCSLTLLSLH